MACDDVFLTFLIITYRRPDKVVRLLESFLDSRWAALAQRFRMEIVVADDHSEDRTQEVTKPVIETLQRDGWLIRYIYREMNLRGDANLYRGLTRDSNGYYVWFLCDDDLIDVPKAICYIEKVAEARPLVALCGFTQGRKGEISNDLGKTVRLIGNLDEAVYYIGKFPKTTAYLVRRPPGTMLDPLFEKWDGTLYAWIGLCIFLMATNPDGRLLLYPDVVATADDDFGVLRYSHRVLKGKIDVVRSSLEHARAPLASIHAIKSHPIYSDEMVLCLGGLTAHYYRGSPIRYARNILKQEWHFFAQNWLAIFTKWRRLQGFAKLVAVLLLRLLPAKWRAG